MKVFISQPMRGRDPEEILEERKKIMDYVRKFHPDAEEIHSYVKNVQMDSKIPELSILGMSLTMMAQADMVVFAPNWIVSRGCLMEHGAADAYGIEIMDMDE